MQKGKNKGLGCNSWINSKMIKEQKRNDKNKTDEEKVKKEEDVGWPLARGPEFDRCLR